MNDRQDIVIIQKIKQGEINLYKQLIDKYQGSLFVMVMNIIKHRETAEDIAQDVFLSAYTHLKTFDPALAKFSTWLFQIARNRCFNEIKKKKEVGMSDIDSHSFTNNPVIWSWIMDNFVFDIDRYAKGSSLINNTLFLISIVSLGSATMRLIQFLCLSLGFTKTTTSPRWGDCVL